MIYFKTRLLKNRFKDCAEASLKARVVVRFVKRGPMGTQGNIE
jgi:hypothetical protein